MIPFRIFYYNGEGLPYTTYDGPAKDAPMFGVQGILVQDPLHGRRRITDGNRLIGLGLYIWIEEEQAWYVCDDRDIITKMQRSGTYRILYGETIPAKDFDAIMKMMEDDQDFPKRSAWAAGEKGPSDS